MSLPAYVVRRLAQSLLILLGLSMLIFLVARIMPGDPARVALGAHAPEETVQRYREWMHYDKPLPVQYYYWLGSLIQGTLGESLITRRNVALDLKAFFPATLELVLFSGLITTVFGILLGAFAARFLNTWIDNVLRVTAYVGVVTPPFIFAILLLLFFGYLLRILPTMGRFSAAVAQPPVVTGMMTIDSLIAGDLRGFFDALKHLLMPALALALGPMSQQARITRASMSDNSRKEYISVARGQGLPERLISTKYLLKPSLIGSVSILGLEFGATLGNAFPVELIFSWPGLSRYGVEAMLHKDLNAITAVVLVIGLVFIVANIVVDLVVVYLDPRIRLEKEK